MPGAVPQILTGRTLLITKLCCVMCNDATKNELARSLSVMPVNYSPFVTSQLSTSLFRGRIFGQQSRQLPTGVIRLEDKTSRDH